MDDARSRPTGVPTLRVLTSCDSTAALIERYARSVSSRGAFVRTREALEVGAAVRFEYLLADGRCALAGEGQVAFCRAESEVGAATGVGVTFEKLRRGDRAVVERMVAARRGAPSRFDQSGDTEGPLSNPPLHPATLFDDVKIGGGVAAEALAAYLSADLTSDLPTSRPPPLASAPVSPLGQLDAAVLANPSRDLADQLEPAEERASALDASALDVSAVDADATPAFVPLALAVERVPAPERAVRVAEPVASAIRGEPPVASAARSDPPVASGGKLLGVLLVLVALGLLGLALSSDALDRWLGP